MKKIGIYSGTFDPVHNGHIAFALDAITQIGLDKVFFLVEPRPRYKQGVKAFEHRTAMMQLAVTGEKRLGMIILEQARFDVAQTWPQIQARFKDAELFMLMGDDVFGRLSHWPRVDHLIRTCRFVVGLRRDKQPELRRHLEAISRTRGIKLEYEAFVPTEYGITSRKIRAALRKGESPDGLPPAVADYIREQGLYSSRFTS